MKSFVKISLFFGLISLTSIAAAATAQCSWGASGVMAHTAIRAYTQTTYERDFTQTLYSKSEAWVWEMAWVKLPDYIVWVDPSDAPLSASVIITTNVQIPGDATGFISLYSPSSPSYLSQQPCSMPYPDLLLPA